MTDLDPARLIIAGFRGSSLPPGYERWLREGSLGGIILFSRNFEGADQASAIVAAARGAQQQMIAAVDQEGGRVQRLKELPLPPAALWQEWGEPTLTREAGLQLGRFLSSVGFNLDFAPVVDVNTNPDNPVIGDRAFGEEVGAVVEYARAFAEGLHEAGVASCAKHFPGHGDTDTDSHLALPRLAHGMQRLEQVELASFAKFVDLPAWMTAHILFTSIDDKNPATLSASAIGVARQKLGYGGVIISDDLEMNAIASHHGYAEAAVAAVEAGCDALLVCSEESAVVEAREALRAEAVRSPVFRERVAQAWRRVAALIERFPMPNSAPGVWQGVIDSPEVCALRRQLSERLAERDD